MAKEPLTTGVAHRLGWTIYWISLVVALVWIGAVYLYLLSPIPEGGSFPWRFFALVAGGGALFAYGAGRFLRHVLSDE